MKISRIDNVEPETPDTPVTMKVCGDIYEIRHMRSPTSCPIKKVSKDWGVDVRSGLAVRFRHTTTRADNTASVAQSLARLRDTLNANCTEPEKCLFLTLTYAENMTDNKRLYKDFHAFWKRFLRYLDQKGHPHPEYIACAEPQGRGAWHEHVIVVFKEKAPFLPNKDISNLWGQGYTRTKALHGVDNYGMYLTAYMTDMELNDSIKVGTFDASRLSEVEAVDKRGQRVKKSIVKGARLTLYPPGFNIMRCSRGIKRPEVYRTTEGEAQAIIKTVGAPLVYQKTIAVSDEAGEVRNVISWRKYNTKYQGGQGEDAGASLPCSDAERQIDGTEGSGTGTP